MYWLRRIAVAPEAINITRCLTLLIVQEQIHQIGTEVLLQKYKECLVIARRANCKPACLPPAAAAPEVCQHYPLPRARAPSPHAPLTAPAKSAASASAALQ